MVLPPRASRLVAGTAVLTMSALPVLAGCAAATRSTSPRGGSVHAAGMRDMNGMGTATGVLPPAAASQPVLLRRNLEMLLGHQVFLLMDMTRSRLRHDPAGAQAAAVAVVRRNAADISATAGTLYGRAVAGSFRTEWNDQIDALLAYQAAVARGDRSAKLAAERRLQRFAQDLGKTLTAAMSGATTTAASRARTSAMVGAVLRSQVRDQTTAIDAYAAHDAARSYTVERQAFTRGVAFADQVAAGLVAAKGSVPPDFDSPRRRLQTALGRLLGEHMWATVTTMRAAAASRPDLAASGAALNANTADLASAMAALYGHASGQRFLRLWATHVDGLVAYATAVGRHDPAGKAAAAARLRGFTEAMATWFATGTSQRLPAVQLAAAFGMHDADLIAQLDAYAAHDYARAEDTSYVIYSHMFDLAQQLAEAIGNSVAARLPRGGAQTGGGGTAPGRTRADPAR